MNNDVYRSEVMLLGWSDSSNRGRTVTFLLDEEGHEHPFKQYTVKSGKHAGQRFEITVRMLNDDEHVTPDNKQPLLSNTAGMLCRDPQFWQWANERSFEDVHDEASARTYICNKCVVTSRAELDTDPIAARRFYLEVVTPFNEYRKTVNSPIPKL